MTHAPLTLTATSVCTAMKEVAVFTIKRSAIAAVLTKLAAGKVCASSKPHFQPTASARRYSQDPLTLKSFPHINLTCKPPTQGSLCIKQTMKRCASQATLIAHLADV